MCASALWCGGICTPIRKKRDCPAGSFCFAMGIHLRGKRCRSRGGSDETPTQAAKGGPLECGTRLALSARDPTLGEANDSIEVAIEQRIVDAADGFALHHLLER